MDRIIKKEPAKRWREAFPLGNGHMGMMVYGGVNTERLTLTENTFFSGRYKEANIKKQKNEVFFKMRRQIEEGEYKAAHESAEEFIGERCDYGTSLPVGDLEMEFGKQKINTAYQRELSLIKGIATSVITGNGFIIKRKAWISYPAGAAVYEVESDIPCSFTIKYVSANPYGEVNYNKKGICFTAKAWETIHCDKKCGVSLCGGLGIVTDGVVEVMHGERKSEEGLKICGSKKTILYLVMETDFDYELKKIETTALRNIVEKRLAVCMEKKLSLLKKEHIADIKSHMKNCTFSVEGKTENLTNISLLFQFGRYLLLSSSRKDSKLPAHLQGIWNDNVACRIGWTCDMHLDINTQMNYWPADITGLAECNEPLFEWIEKILLPHGRKSAKDFYGMEGWIAELVSNAWGYTDPYWAVPLAPCPTGGVWILTHMWEHYLYTQNEIFLVKKVLPLTEGAVRFFVNYFFAAKDGYYRGGPSISPENSFTVEGERCWLSNGCTYEVVMVRELFHIFDKLYHMFPDKCEKTLYNKAEEIREKLLPYRILNDGTIAEWAHDYPAEDKQHRHTSHLLGLFPFAQITKEETPYLAKAAGKTIEKKLQPEEGWEDTGWARSMLMLYEARLGDGEKAYYHMKQMIKGLLSSNYFIMHPPTRGAASFDDVYELDGNTGFTSCIAEMLMQSHNGCIRLLPALPSEWENGYIKGLCARGGVRVDISWKKGMLQEAVFYSRKTKKINVSYQGKIEEIQLKSKIKTYWRIKNERTCDED